MSSFYGMKRYSMQHPHAEWGRNGKKLEPITHLGTYEPPAKSPSFVRNFDPSECVMSFPKRGRRTIEIR